MQKFSWVALVIALVAMGYLIDVIDKERNKTQTELEKIRSQLDEVTKEHAEVVELLCDCADDLWHAYQRWDEYEMHESIAAWMCACLSPPPYSIGKEMECIAITLEAEKRFEEMERKHAEEASEIW